MFKWVGVSDIRSELIQALVTDLLFFLMHGISRPAAEWGERGTLRDGRLLSKAADITMKTLERCGWKRLRNESDCHEVASSVLPVAGLRDASRARSRVGESWSGG